MIILYNKGFKKAYQRLSKKIKEKFEKRIFLFEDDEFNPVLNNHSLKGKYSGYRSINITGDLRAIYRKKTTEIMFVAIDSHSNLYGQVIQRRPLWVMRYTILTLHTSYTHI
ncbi:MAG: type II toxin-antitoxin system mRNA interferase toxin, RelE/StbE family [Candidatus Daviesbacteria bacterium]|nr:type II toxin-antitoxin system mRNA interferase toxin, RelE/StbE family [Candidatus Daviesbacteria bacterium]